MKEEEKIASLFRFSFLFFSHIKCEEVLQYKVKRGKQMYGDLKRDKILR